MKWIICDNNPVINLFQMGAEALLVSILLISYKKFYFNRLIPLYRKACKKKEEEVFFLL